ncbi:MAG: hypothetical protein EXS42_04175 [Lacunisphaera sp.]|nr:hypothetical protein [Lacunisphaera sp.]
MIGSLVAAKDVAAPMAPPAEPMTAAAKPGPGPGELMRSALGERLGLTGEQMNKLEGIHAEIRRRRQDRQGFGSQQGQPGQRGSRPAGLPV